MRINTFDCAMYHHTNLVPRCYEMDDYQVRTPTDIIGQHIHLPKWDLTTTDGAANGWNYEDGTLSPGAVRERIHAINALQPDAARATRPTAPDAGTAARPLAAGRTRTSAPRPRRPSTGPGARTTIQRWFFDPVVNADGVDRGLGIIFTHDHYGPSTHQQIGLYATVLASRRARRGCTTRPACPLYTRAATAARRAGRRPSSTGRRQDSFREFYFEFSDFQHAYEAGVYVGAARRAPWRARCPTADSFRNAINPPVRPWRRPRSPTSSSTRRSARAARPRPCPEAISADDPGFLVVNYRNEPVGLRVYDPNKVGPDGKPGCPGRRRRRRPRLRAAEPHRPQASPR